MRRGAKHRGNFFGKFLLIDVKNRRSVLMLPDISPAPRFSEDSRGFQ